MIQHPVRLWQDIAWMRKDSTQRELAVEETEGVQIARRLSSSLAKTVKKDRVSHTVETGSHDRALQHTVETGSHDHSPSSTKMVRGRLGHLVTALADARLQAASTPAPPPPSPTQTQAWTSSLPSTRSDREDNYSNVVVTMCLSCDRMFCSQHELTAHEQYCTTQSQ